MKLIKTSFGRFLVNERVDTYSFLEGFDAALDVWEKSLKKDQYNLYKIKVKPHGIKPTSKN